MRHVLRSLRHLPCTYVQPQVDHQQASQQYEHQNQGESHVLIVLGKYPPDVGETGERKERPDSLYEVNLLWVPSNRWWQLIYEDSEPYIDQSRD